MCPSRITYDNCSLHLPMPLAKGQRLLFSHFAQEGGEARRICDRQGRACLLPLSLRRCAPFPGFTQSIKVDNNNNNNNGRAVRDVITKGISTSQFEHHFKKKKKTNKKLNLFFVPLIDDARTSFNFSRFFFLSFSIAVNG